MDGCVGEMHVLRVASVQAEDGADPCLAGRRVSAVDGCCCCRYRFEDFTVGADVSHPALSAGQVFRTMLHKHVSTAGALQDEQTCLS
jgi:hypothetical protein